MKKLLVITFILYLTTISCVQKEDLSTTKQKLIGSWTDISYAANSEQKLVINKDGSFRAVRLNENGNSKSEIVGTWEVDEYRFLWFKYSNQCSRYGIVKLKKTLVLDCRVDIECPDKLFSGHVLWFKKM